MRSSSFGETATELRLSGNGKSFRIFLVFFCVERLVILVNDCIYNVTVNSRLSDGDF